MSLGSVALAPDEKWVTGPGPNFNEPHRSPEAWCGARRNQASDVFAFGTLVRGVVTFFLASPCPLLVPDVSRHLD
jgi:hypothetical protein